MGPKGTDKSARRAFLYEEKVGGQGRGPIGGDAEGVGREPFPRPTVEAVAPNGEPQPGNFSEERKARRAAARGHRGWAFKSCGSRSWLSIRCDETS